MLHEDVQLLPFTYRVMPQGFLVVNQAGEYLWLSRSDFDRLLSGNRERMGELYYRFKGKHLVVDDDDEELAVEMLATKLRTRKGYLKAFTSLHMIVATLRCNFRCDYCHASSSDRDRADTDMSWDTAKHVVNLIFESPSPAIKIEFQGGEPLLNWDLVEETIRYAEVVNRFAGRNLEFVICTNLTMVTPEMLTFCKKHRVSLSTSLDGPGQLHDLHRKRRDGGSGYETFRKKLDLTREYLGQDGCSALLTVTRDHLNRLPEVVDHYAELGFNGVFLRSLNPYGYAAANLNDLGYSPGEFLVAYKTALDYIIDMNFRGTPFVEYYAALMLQRILTPFATGFVDLQSPSGAGISGVIYDYNGDVYPADEARMLARTGDRKFCMGNVLDNSYEELFHGRLVQDLVHKSCVEVMPGCATCAYQIYCGADPVRYYAESGDVTGSRPDSGFCQKNKGIIDHIFELLLRNDNRLNNLFWAWITSRNLKDMEL